MLTHNCWILTTRAPHANQKLRGTARRGGQSVFHVFRRMHNAFSPMPRRHTSDTVDRDVPIAISTLKNRAGTARSTLTFARGNDL